MARAIALALVQPFIVVKTMGFNLKANAKVFPRLFFLSLLAFLSFLLIISVWQINGYSQDIFLLQTLGQKMNTLSKENKSLEINFNKAKSLEGLNKSFGEQEFERAVKIEYVRVLDSKVISRLTK